MVVNILGGFITSNGITASLRFDLSPYSFKPSLKNGGFFILYNFIILSDEIFGSDPLVAGGGGNRINIA